MKWCNYVSCWVTDVMEISEGQLPCEYDCDDCEYCEEVNYGK